MRCSLVFALVLVLVGCAGSGGGETPLPTAAPVDISGYWAGSVLNADQATYTNCTGDLAGYEGFTVADVVGSSTCTPLDPLQATQSGATYTIEPVRLVCSSSSQTASGGGTIVADTFTGRLQNVDTGNAMTSTLPHSGAMSSSTTFRLSETSVVLSGSLSGSCTLNPALETDFTISAVPPPGLYDVHPTLVVSALGTLAARAR